MADTLARGRAAYSTRAWTSAYEALRAVDRGAALEAEDVELLAGAAFMVGREDEYLAELERAHHAHVDAGEPIRAVRCAFWVGVHLARRGDTARASGWLGRAQRLLEREGHDCVERGYLRLPAIFEHEAGGDHDAALAAAAEAVEVAQRFDDRDLFALAVHEQGHIRIRQGRVREGLGLLDEAMVAVTAGELSPIVTGLVYCGVIDGCQKVHELRRAQEWTEALGTWCDEQPEMVAFTGRCLLHRAEIMELRGAWSDALDEARRAGERVDEKTSPLAVAEAFYRQGEIHRLHGELGAAEQAYREAGRRGWEPQPGLALTRLEQGADDAAEAAMRRALGEATDALQRANLLPAQVEIALAIGNVDEARAACRELTQISVAYESEMLTALAAHATGAVELAAGDAGEALVPLRRAWAAWKQLDAPYEAARVRVLIALACRSLGDEDTAGLDLEAARGSFAKLGAAPDLARVDSLIGEDIRGEAAGLTPREHEVLRHLAAGETNKEIAGELVVSERTVDRHVSNILAKLRVSSRSAATAYAYEHNLL